MVSTARVRAPELEGAGGFIGTAGPLTLAALRGRVVLLDFFTQACINCIHVLEELRELERQFGDDLLVIGVHSPKFPHEHDHEAVVRAVERLGITHPVLDDPELRTWSRLRGHGLADARADRSRGLHRPPGLRRGPRRLPRAGHRDAARRARRQGHARPRPAARRAERASAAHRAPLPGQGRPRPRARPARRRRHGPPPHRAARRGRRRARHHRHRRARAPRRLVRRRRAAVAPGRHVLARRRSGSPTPATTACAAPTSRRASCTRSAGRCARPGTSRRMQTTSS